VKVAVRDLKTHLSAYLRRVKAGERVIVTDHGEPCAVIQPFPPVDPEAQVRILANNPNVTWNGRRFAPPSEGVAAGGQSMADMVLEDRG
jgi:prevent-host-death family protein